MDNPTLPIPISHISGRYLLFSIEAVTYLRREHNICGVLTGTLPQASQQNVFLGLPLQLMPEEARVLVDKGIACIIDEAKAQTSMISLMEEDRRRYKRELEAQGHHVTRLLADRKNKRKEEALKKIAENKAKKSAKADAESEAAASSAIPAEEESAIVDVFADDSASRSSTPTSAPQEILGVTPPTSYPPLPNPTTSSDLVLSKPEVPLSYPLFAHLHSRGYFLSPGLRFGCQYVAYPGDPLRFHSHFLVVSAEYDQQIDLMDIVNGGRLGTGVKKGFLLGGPQKSREEAEIERTESVVTYSIEWAGM
ncbi:tRNA-splicing endonuclease subunit tsp-4 [Penicillium chermesinum]|uniref:tRNA-splicing endonuclease subunit Sen34 n=1 Tax=Penicillium chermesinum TaxID=63820 RepID=A0A9W9TYH9_9EURO|nr:tRNA-splicing endonuclease subunit tsp-4 [Penicillium chermesinum]KAJ5246324.1 tRNA-splicing endonuclease subunit tsp-4 [Penicillium chermesinum]KAJ6144610.1 tRNA-splicing endonuclease subunit tsp-4 [Penicillium chermesinum]